MTVIAWKDGVLASDGVVNYNGVRIGEVSKIIKPLNKYKGSEYLLALSGDLNAVNNFATWILNDNRGALPTILSAMDGRSAEVGFDCIIVAKDYPGVCFWYDIYCVEQRIKSEIAAIGGGSEFAIGAMAAGASAEEAVKIACEHNIYCGGEIQTLQF